jgi:hypothetical protein
MPATSAAFRKSALTGDHCRDRRCMDVHLSKVWARSLRKSLAIKLPEECVTGWQATRDFSSHTQAGGRMRTSGFGEIAAGLGRFIEPDTSRPWPGSMNASRHFQYMSYHGSLSGPRG